MRVRRSLWSARRVAALGYGGTLAAAGLAFAVMGAPNIGGIATLLGVVGLVFGIHSFGRLGSDTTVRTSDARRKNLSNRTWLGGLAFGIGVIVLADGRLAAKPGERGIAAMDRVGSILLAAVAVGAGGMVALSARKRLAAEKGGRLSIEKG